MKQPVGDCINCFNSSGDCVITKLPWQHVSDFANDVENNIQLLSRDIFVKETEISPELYCLNSELMLFRGFVYCIYDLDRDIHYFFV